MFEWLDELEKLSKIIHGRRKREVKLLKIRSNCKRKKIAVFKLLSSKLLEMTAKVLLCRNVDTDASMFVK